MSNLRVFSSAAVLALLLQLAGCSSTSNTAAASDKSGDIKAVQNEQAESDDSDQVAANDSQKVHCTHEKKIGSNRKFLRCFTVEEKDRMREAARDAWLRSQQGSETGGG
tara:strand:+ start:4987 stop:5313 length:327 start_codon:yes stop_codon:yes gene_type:complete